MHIYQLRREQVVPLNLEETFAFFSDARNLERLTPSWLHFEVLTPDPIVLQTGSLIDYRLRLRGMPLRWQSEITVWEPPYRFVDLQRHGPYRLWQHTHTFEPLGSSTIVRDDVRYAVLGDDLVNRFLVRPDLEHIFDYRTRALNDWVLERLGQQQGAGGLLERSCTEPAGDAA